MPNLNVTERDNWAVESPWASVAGETVTFTVTFLGATAATSPVATVYQNKTDVTSTIMPSGSASASGNVVTLKPMTAMTGGKRYVVSVSATVDGNTRVKKFMVICQKGQLEQ